MFDWIEDLQGCANDFKPDGTVFVLYTISEYHRQLSDPDRLKKQKVLQIGSTAPIDYELAMSKPIEQVFDWFGKKFWPNEIYYVAAMYFAEEDD